MNSVISTKEVTVLHDREGEVKGFIRIGIKISDRDTQNKELKIFTKDTRVIKGLVDILDEEGVKIGEEIQELDEFPIFNRAQKAQEKTYSKSYEEYNAQKAALSTMYADEIAELELEGLELEDFLLIKALMISLTVDPIYGLTGADFEIEN